MNGRPMQVERWACRLTPLWLVIAAVILADVRALGSHEWRSAWRPATSARGAALSTRSLGERRVCGDARFRVFSGPQGPPCVMHLLGRHTLKGDIRPRRRRAALAALATHRASRGQGVDQCLFQSSGYE